MAALFDEMTTICCLACESPKIVYICMDCLGPRLHLCRDCYKGHATAGHKVIDMNEYEKYPSRYLLAENRECKRHQPRQVELVCALCKMMLCLMCPHDSSVVCDETPGGRGKHEPGPLKTAVELDKKTIDVSLGTAAHSRASVKAAMNRYRKMKDDAHIRHNKVKDKAEANEHKLISALKVNTKAIIDKSASHLEQVSITIDSTLENMGYFLENLQGTCEEAEGLKSSLAYVTVHRCTPSVVDRLTTRFTFPEPDIPTLELEQPSELNEGDDLKRQVGSLVSYLRGERLVEENRRWAPVGCCVIKTAKGNTLVEAYRSFGLFFAAPGEAKKKISVDGIEHRGICTSPDEKMIYSTTSQKTICMYTVEGDNLQLVGEVSVEGALNLWGIVASLATGDLAVLDNWALRITLHSQSAVLLRSIENVLKGGHPYMLEWSPRGDHLFITDRGEGDVEQSVLKLKVDPAEITWRKSLDNKPSLVRHIDDMLYITHYDAPTKVTVISADDGSLIKTIRTPRHVQEVRKSSHVEVEMVHYD